MNEDQWREYRAYADRVSLRLREAEHPGIPAPPGVEWQIDIEGTSSLDTELIAEAIASIAWSQGSDTFVMEERRDTTEWGASGAFWALLATFGTGVLTNAAYDSVKSLIHRMLGQGPDGLPSEPISSGEAQERAAVAVSSGDYEESASDLQVVGLDSEPGGDGVTTIMLKSNRSARTYTVRLELLNGLATIARIEMREE